MPKITADLRKPDKTQYNDEVKFVPLGNRNFLNSDGDLIIGLEISTTGAILRALLDDPESETYLELEGGCRYAVRVGDAEQSVIEVPTGDGTYDLTALLSVGVVALPTFNATWPSGGEAGQALFKTGNGYGAAAWQDVPAASATSWGDIEGTLANQLDLQAALDAKAAASHTHVIGDVTNLQATLDGKAAASHTHAIGDITGLQTALDGKAVPAIQVTALPGSPTRGQPYELTQADDTALAAPGFYIHDGTGWFCLAYSYRYELPGLSGSVSLSLIPGLEYYGSIQGNVDPFTVSFVRTGVAGLFLTNTSGYTLAQPTMAGRTTLLLNSTAWDGAGGTYVKIVLEDEGLALIAAASSMVL